MQKMDTQKSIVDRMVESYSGEHQSRAGSGKRNAAT